VSPVKYELGFYITEDDILHSHRCEKLKFYTGSHLISTRIYIGDYNFVNLIVAFDSVNLQLPYIGAVNIAVMLCLSCGMSCSLRVYVYSPEFVCV
jgi:hypothetical protein